jgi:ATP-binding cassette subfamily B protein
LSEQQTLVDFLSTVEFFSAFGREELAQLAEHAESRSFDFGDTIFNAGDRGEGLFVVKSGTVRIFTEEQGKEISMGVRKVGEVFAEIAALKESRHESSARASSKTELIFISRQALAAVLVRNEAARTFIATFVAISSAGGFVTRLFDLRGKVEQREIEDFVRSVGVKRVRAGRVILEQDSREDRRLYVVRQGKVKIARHDNGVEYPLATLTQGEVFGEKACLLRQEQPASAIAQSDVVLLVIPEQTVHFILGRNPRLREVLEERIRFTERELQRQKKIADRRRRPALLDLSTKPKLGERVIKRFPLVEQAEEMDCGAACLAMICKHYGIPMTLGKLREMANVTTERVAGLHHPRCAVHL